MSQAHDVCEISRQDLILVVGLVACVGAKADDPWATVAVVGGGRVLAQSSERGIEGVIHSRVGKVARSVLASFLPASPRYSPRSSARTFPSRDVMP